MLWPSRKKMIARTTTSRNCPIPNEGGFRPAGSGIFDGLAMLDSNHLGQFWGGSTGWNPTPSASLRAGSNVEKDAVRMAHPALFV